MRKYGWIALIVVILDQLSKAGARLLNAPVMLLPGVLGLKYAENTGIAFGMLAGKPWLLGVLSLALITLGALALGRYRLGKLPQIAAMLMLGGAVGNMIDRFFTGYVVDMVEILLFRFAIFNLADTALTIGCALMAFSLLFRPKDWSEKKHGAANDDTL